MKITTFRAPSAVFLLVRTIVTCGLALILAQAFAQNANRATNSHNGPPLKGDRALQKQVLPMVSAPINLNFAGIPEGGEGYPDVNLAIGPNYIVQVANSSFAVYSKTSIVYPNFPMPFSTFFKSCAAVDGGYRFFSPIVLYDRQADRWLLEVINAGTGYFPPLAECVAISKTNDPTGDYVFYQFQPLTNNLTNDLIKTTKVSVWPTPPNADGSPTAAYLFTFNVYGGHAMPALGASICALDRTKVLALDPTAALVCAQNPDGTLYLTPPDEEGYLPSDNDGPTAPAQGTPGLFLNWHSSTNQLYLRMLAVNFNAGTVALSNPTPINVPPANMVCGDNSGPVGCIPQPGIAQQLDAGGDRLMYRFPVRHFPDHDRAVATHVVSGSAAGSAVALRWYELYDPAGSVTVHQQGTFAPDSTDRWMASMAEDKNGDIAVGYSASSPTIYPSIRFTGRVPSDPAGTLESEASILMGSTSQTNGPLWGTYTALQVDPGDDCTFWYSNQYVKNDGSNNWLTEIASFKFLQCQ
jgi:hypothetical protein